MNKYIYFWFKSIVRIYVFDIFAKNYKKWEQEILIYNN